MISAEDLLKPISEASPCGEDLYYDAGFQELETLMKGKPETQFSPAEDPDWKKLHDRCLELLAKSKDLRVAATLCLSALKVEGILSLPESLGLLKGLLERYWEPVYPRLDPDDGNDPLYRMNVVAALAIPRGTFGDPMRFLDRLYETPLASSTQFGRFGAADVERSQKGEPGADGQAPPSADQIKGAFRDTDPEQLKAVHQAVADSVRIVGQIDALLTSLVGASKAPNLDLLETALQGIRKHLAPYLPAGAVEAGTEAGQGEAAPAGTVRGADGDIRSRADVVRTLDRICDYYRQAEPSSPVPYLLQRAKRLAEMDFMEIIDDMSPEAMTHIQTITGQKPEQSGS